MLHVATNDAGGLYYRSEAGGVFQTTRNWGSPEAELRLAKRSDRVLVFADEWEAYRFLAAYRTPGALTLVRPVTEDDRDEFGERVCFVGIDSEGKFTFRSGVLAGDLGVA